MTIITKTNARDERTQISDALTTLDTTTATNTADIATNTADIATNTADIATNTSAISALDARVTALEDGVDGRPPTSLKGRIISNANLTGAVSGMDSLLTASANASTYDAWTTVLSETAKSGVIQHLSLWQTANTSDRDASARLTVDGTVVWATDANCWQVAADNNAGVGIVAGEIGADSAWSSLPFNTGFSLQVKKTENAAGTVSFAAAYSYYLTS